MIAITADKFSRIINALSSQRPEVGAEWPFMVAPEVEIVAWVPRAGHLTLQIQEFDAAPVATVTVCPGEYRNFDVIAGNGLGIGETRGAEAAFSLALDHLLNQM